MPPNFVRHVFVCTNERAPDNPRGSCKQRGGEAVRDAFKKQLGAAGVGKAVRANAAGCLDQCDLGVAVVVYPEQVWYGGVTLADVPEIIEEHIIGGRPVTRLLMPAQPVHEAALVPLTLPPKAPGRPPQ